MGIKINVLRVSVPCGIRGSIWPVSMDYLKFPYINMETALVGVGFVLILLPVPLIFFPIHLHIYGNGDVTIIAFCYVLCVLKKDVFSNSG